MHPKLIAMAKIWKSREKLLIAEIVLFFNGVRVGLPLVLSDSAD